VLDTWCDRSYPGSILASKAFTQVCSCVCELCCLSAGLTHHARAHAAALPADPPRTLLLLPGIRSFGSRSSYTAGAACRSSIQQSERQSCTSR
jgi:hypothetical protein